jgi:A/G-specific adenine glycosylase
MCEARRRGIQEDIPPLARPTEIVSVEESAVVVWKQRTVLLAQRPVSGRWAGLWEFPHGPREGGESYEQAAERHLRESTGISAEIGQELMTLRHGITRYRIKMACFEAAFRGGSFEPSYYQEGRWVPPAQLVNFPVSAPQRRLAERQQRLF